MEMFYIKDFYHRRVKMKRNVFFVGILASALVFGLGLTGCSSLISSLGGENKKTEEAAKNFIGKTTEEVLAIGSPKYVQTGGAVEQYAFYNWDVRRAGGDAEAKAPAVSSGATMVIFTCSGGNVTAYKLQADQPQYFGSWTRM
jgi:hypothetical protein